MAHPTDLLAAARSFVPELERRAPEFEAARRLPEDLARRMAGAGLFGLCVPAAYGGAESDPITLTRIIETLAEADGSAAWCVFIGATSGLTAAYLPEASAKAVFSRPDVITGGVFAPRGRAERIGQDRFRVNGRWQWGSGTQNADWVMGGCLLARDGVPEVLDNGVPATRMFFAPASAVTIHDETWRVSGLKGTGSNDFSFNGLEIDAAYSVGLSTDRPLPRPLYAFPPFGLLAMGIGAVALGLARTAIDTLAELAGAKTPEGHRRPLAQRAETQERLAWAEASYASARVWLYDVIGRAWQAAQADGHIGIEHRRDLRLATTFCTRQAAAVVDAMYQLGGGSSVYDTNRLQRCFRDVHVATQHMLVGTPTLELVGRVFLGVDADLSQL